MSRHAIPSRRHTQIKEKSCHGVTTAVETAAYPDDLLDLGGNECGTPPRVQRPSRAVTPRSGWSTKMPSTPVRRMRSNSVRQSPQSRGALPTR